MTEFDVMRMFYVALSRAQNLLVIAHYAGRGQSINEPFSSMLDNSFPRIRQFDVQSLPEARQSDKELPKTYSYTGDYLLYKRCPRQYMAFRKYGFAPARSQTMFFGSLVHQTIDDLHQHLISLRGGYGQQANG
jgi:DNA helicase-2/ATP-dependent DNA helicase PcrA